MTGHRLKREVESLFDVVKPRCTSDELVFMCPVPSCGDRTGNRSVNLKNGKTNCWRCNVAGDFVSFCRKLGYEVDNEGVADPDLGEAERLAQNFDGDGHRDIVPAGSSCKLPRGFTPITEKPNSVYSQLIGEMAEKKHLSWQDFADVGVGFTRDDPSWEPFAIFPIVEWGRMVYYQGRLYHPEPGQKTKKFPPNREVTYGSKYWIYNLDHARLQSSRVIVVFESILNVLSFQRKALEEGINDVTAVAIFKHAVSGPQRIKLLNLRNAREFCFFFDSDATDSSWKWAQRFTNQRQVTVAEMPVLDGNTRSDANDNIDVAWDQFLNRRPAGSPLDELAKEIELL